MKTNDMCDGSGPCTPGEVRVSPYSVDGNLILCFSCYNREMIYRRQRNFDLSEDCKFKVPHWKDLAIYTGA